MMMLSRTAIAARTVTRAVGARPLSTAAGGGPKMHRAKEMWQELEKTRAPIDADDTHVRT